MPNHTSNYLEIIADKEVVDRILEEIKGEDEGQLIDFNKIIPKGWVEAAPYSFFPRGREEDVKNFAAALKCGYDDLTLYLEGETGNIFQALLRDLKQGDKITDELLIQILLETRNEILGYYLLNKIYGLNSGYDWSIEFWGSKWNAYDMVVSDNTIFFHTAWYGVEKVVIALSKKYPEAKFRYKSCNEQAGAQCFDITFQNGEQDGIYYDNESKSAYELFFELQGGEESYEYSEEQGTYIYVEE